MKITMQPIIYLHYMKLIDLKMDIYRDSIYCGKEIVETGFLKKEKKVRYFIKVYNNFIGNIYYMNDKRDAYYWFNQINSMKSRLEVLQTLQEYCQSREIEPKG